MSRPPAIELRALRRNFGKTEIIRGTDLKVNAGERVAIIGPNGAGKSTLFNLISGRFGPTSGQILLNGKRIDGLLPYEINRLGLARSFQITNIFGRLSVFENLRCGLLTGGPRLAASGAESRSAPAPTPAQSGDATPRTGRHR